MATLVELRDYLAEHAPMPDPDLDPDNAEYRRVMDRRYELAAAEGFDKLDVLRTRLAEQWDKRR